MDLPGHGALQVVAEETPSSLHSGYIQSDGGPIGLRVANPIAKIRVARWVKLVLKYLDDSDVEVLLVKSYVDDIQWLLQRISRGIEWCDVKKKVIFDQEQCLIDTGKDDIMKTQEVLLERMNSVCSDLAFTAENQHEYRDGYIPTLDF